MPEFSYKAAKRDGSLAQGVVDAPTEAIAATRIRSQGLVVISVESAAKQGSGGKKAFGKNQVLSFTSELAVLLRAGLPIDRALKVLIDMAATSAARQVYEDILATVKGGKGFSVALAEKPELFDEFYVSMIRSGEASGNLAAVLGRLAAQLENAKQVRSSVVSALIYPAILAVVSVLSVLVMLGFVVPQFEALFADMGESLPLVTELVIAGGEAIKNNGIYLVLLAGLAVYFVRRWLRNPQGKTWLDTKLLKLPVFGSVVVKYQVARFARTLGTLLESGVSVLQAINISVETVSNTVVRESLEGLAPAVKGGGRVSQALQDSGDFSPMVVQMVRVGEESGQLGDMMLELARVYDDEVSAGIKRSLTLLEPLLILGMGGMIGFIIVAILMGILSVNDLAV
ncbi:type II secretion system F family protein [Gilvimarinus xylanilyticus]|uniref:Type II secretion system F family protein n=1 Tax=Gilvimarinus xylanilyticus TaxID=2944139 RepID=A0A9X2KTN0_9GAMM|nr:type II secretion system F family protein [Gilvimarinus xylanilyticus]MCP8899367.1 type II secretion system F family protein [Gilvimarinus xylanilyticus]